MSGKMKLNFNINGKNIQLNTPPLRRVIDILREDLGLHGTKEGCGEGECGSCTVLINGKAVCSCITPAFQIAGKKIITIEGITRQSKLHPIQNNLLEEGGVQCGFCTPGIVISSIELLEKKKFPSRDEIRKGIGGNLCRCTGYEKIFKAIEKSAYTLSTRDDSRD